MFSLTDYQAIVSGQRRGLLPATARTMLHLAELPYYVAIKVRNHRFDRRHELTTSVSVPVISVGNITTGGTGKTPMVAWIARWLRDRGLRVTLISRGYKASNGVNDEALELADRLPDVPHVQNPDRVEAAKMAIHEFDSQVILLDDAFQHRRIHRDLDIVLLDALQPYGHGHLLPRGMLREPLMSLQRADIIVLSRADAVDEQTRRSIKDQVRRIPATGTWVEVAHAAQSLIDFSGRPQPPETLQNKRVAAFCGIGNPEGFRHSLCQCGASVVAFRTFPDHHAYQRTDIDSLGAWLAGRCVDAVICTHKDLVKIRQGKLADVPLLALQVGIEMLEGGDHFEAQLHRLLAT